ncbi:hypothetical protein DL93DRAFT_2232087 [Clavulina sp. PMI_390]|nr:hypothetical protein DL93DRAFT_2232087 [Clavulina sp. PMI_390]
MASLSVYTAVVLVCPAVLEQQPSSSTVSVLTANSQASVIASSPSSTFVPATTTPAPTSTQSWVAVPIHTTVTVDVFPPNLHLPSSYTPIYEAHADGSLVTSLFEEQVGENYFEALLFGIYCSVFAYTLWKGLSYLRRAGPRARAVFIVLCASQLLGLMANIAVAVGFKITNADCRAINLIASICGVLSYGIIITGILGFKVYRILEGPRWLLGILSLFQIAGFALFAADLPSMTDSRDFTGTCEPANKLHYIPFAMLVMFCEILLISGCFLYAIYRTRRRWDVGIAAEDQDPPAFWRRPSLASFLRRNTELSIEGEAYSTSLPSPKSHLGARLRGWFSQPKGIANPDRMSDVIVEDVVATGEGESAPQPPLSSHQPSRQGSGAGNAQGGGDVEKPGESRKPSGPTPRLTAASIITLSPGARHASLAASDGIWVSSEKQSIRIAPESPVAAERSPSPDLLISSGQNSSRRPRIRMRPRPRQQYPFGVDPLARFSTSMRAIPTKFIHSSREIFRKVLRDELLSTSAISGVLLASTLASFIGAWAGHLLIGRSVILNAGWVVTSLLVMRSFGGVIRRAERSAILREHWENINTNPGNGRVPERGLSDLVFANPNDLSEFGAQTSPVPENGGIQWREPFNTPNSPVDIEAWRTRPSIVDLADIVGGQFLYGDTGDVSPKNITGMASRQSSQPPVPVAGPSSFGPGQSPPTRAISPLQARKTSVGMPPSLRSLSSYWATKSNSTTNAALDALRRNSVLTISQSIGIDVGSAQDSRDNSHHLDEDLTPVPGARVPAPYASHPPRSYRDSTRTSLKRRSRVSQVTAASDHYSSDLEALVESEFASEPLVITPSRRSSQVLGYPRHSRTLSAPDISARNSALRASTASNPPLPAGPPPPPNTSPVSSQ